MSNETNFDIALERRQPQFDAAAPYDRFRPSGEPLERRGECAPPVPGWRFDLTRVHDLT
jgi:hypothetical protein